MLFGKFIGFKSYSFKSFDFKNFGFKSFSFKNFGFKSYVFKNFGFKSFGFKSYGNASFFTLDSNALISLADIKHSLSTKITREKITDSKNITKHQTKSQNKSKI